MDDIYEDLDNYDDLNIIEQLKKENHDLKHKLEENTIAMSKLQKDFDKLSAEFKKLEMNYSSLLKTAKVEIERKTKIITDLNIEKDMIVINALKNRKSFSDIKKLKSVTNTYTKTPSNVPGRSNVPLADNSTGKNNNLERKDEIRFSSVDTTTTSGNTDITSKLMHFAHKNENTELWSDRTSDMKENITQRTKQVENNKALSSKALSIKNRRKSMPLIRSQNKYSSDEECEDRYCTNDFNRKKTREDPTRHDDKNCIDSHRYKGHEDRNRASEMSNTGDKYYGYSGSNRDSYRRSRNYRHHGTDQHRGRSKYDVSLRHRRLSPERPWRPRNDGYQRQDHNVYRVLESPPPEKFHQYQLRTQEKRYKRDREDAHDVENRDTIYDKYSSRHKTSDYYDEPISKRQRRDSFPKFSDDELRSSHERPLEKPLPDMYVNLHQDLSCQSPDYIVPNEILHPVKEIMNTASIPLEDPRIHSKKYVLKTSDENVELSTVTGRNVELKLLDATLWDNTQPEVPGSLKRRPSQCSEDIVKEIYMGIDNPVSNMSTESGEILSFDAEDNSKGARIVPDEIIPTHTQNIGSIPEKLPNKNDISLNKYKIPKIKKSEKNNGSQDERLPKQRRKAEKPLDRSVKDQNDKEIPENNMEKLIKVTKDKLQTPTFHDDNCTTNFSNINREPASSLKELIAGDLELSDETCDNSEVQRHAIQKPEIKDNVASQSNAPELPHIPVDKSTNQETIEAKPVDTAQDDSKRKISKKKHAKNKELSKLTKSVSIEKEPDSKSKPKKDSKDPKEIKTKFSELFGDSSSLITPEDLGILAIQAQDQPPVSYVPICEDAQDAVDVQVSNVPKVQTRLSKLKSMEAVQPKQCIENDSNKSDIKIKNQNKFSNDAKKKSRKNSAQVTDKSKIREVYQSLTADKLVKEKNEKVSEKEKNKVSKENIGEVTPDVTALKQTVIAETQEPCQVDSCKVLKESVDEPTITSQVSDMLPKQNVLLRALATSTPQKEPQIQNPGVEAVAKEQPSSWQSSSKEASCDIMAVSAVSQSSNETMDPQNDDVPDVRIFVKRRRRVKVPKTSVV